jgi:hypothetical protein
MVQSLPSTADSRSPLERLICKWEDTIKIDVRVIGWGGICWIDLAQDRDQWLVLVIMVTDLRVP